MSCFRRWGLPALILCLPVLALSIGAGRADDNASPLDAKAVDALVHKTLRDVINEGADMYNAGGHYKNMERDYAGCYHFYEGALLTTRPLLAAHPDLQKAIDEAMDSARDTPRMEMRAFVLRAVIDKIRDGVKGDQPAVAPSPKTLWDRLGGEAAVAKVVDDFTAAAAKDPKVDFTRGGKYKLDEAAVTHFKKGMIDFVSSATGGPLKYEGKNMKDLHKGMEITNEEFDAAAKHLKDALEKNGVKAEDAKAVLAAVDSTRKDIVEGKKEPTPLPKETTTTGKVVRVEGNKLTVNVDGKEQSIQVSPEAKVVIDGKDGKVENIKKDSTATVTSKGEVVTKVEANSPVPPLPPPLPGGKETIAAGKVTKVEKDKLTLKDDEGKEKSFTVPETAKLTINGKDGKLVDVKTDSSVTVTSKGDEVTKVEVKGPTAPPPPPPAETLWDRLGGEANVAKVVDDFVNTAGKDPKVNFFRDPTVTPTKEEVSALKKNLVEFFSSATGGPLKYDGKSMKDAHKGMKITDEEFDASVADLKAALEKNGAKADDVKAVLAAVEGTRKDVVEAKTPEDKDKPKPVDKPEGAGVISGKVTYKGKPVTGGVVGLTDADGKAVTGKLADDGTYKVEALKPGKYTVTLSTEGLNDPTKPNPLYVPVPVAYRDAKTSPLTVEVRKGDQTLDLNLAD
jgi:hemoglobin